MTWKKLDLSGDAGIIVDKINNLPIEPEFQIGKEHIKGLDEELTAIRNLPRGTFGSGRRVFQPYRDDFSSLTDGSTKIFYLSRAPLDEGTVMVFGTDFEDVLYPTDDFYLFLKKIIKIKSIPVKEQNKIWLYIETVLKNFELEQKNNQTHGTK